MASISLLVKTLVPPSAAILTRRACALCARSLLGPSAEPEDFAVLSFLQDTVERSRQLVSAYKAGGQANDTPTSDRCGSASLRVRHTFVRDSNRPKGVGVRVVRAVWCAPVLVCWSCRPGSCDPPWCNAGAGGVEDFPGLPTEAAAAAAAKPKTCD
eukprot:3813811-Prymnesium_polylepis.2